MDCLYTLWDLLHRYIALFRRPSWMAALKCVIRPVTCSPVCRISTKIPADTQLIVTDDRVNSSRGGGGQTE